MAVTESRLEGRVRCAGEIQLCTLLYFSVDYVSGSGGR